ncbi:MAG: DUF885 domain-containing protein [Parvularculaceae bacterium]
MARTDIRAEGGEEIAKRRSPPLSRATGGGFRYALPALLICAFAGATSASASSYQSLDKVARDWRAFQPPKVENCAPDYSVAAMTEKANGLATFQKRFEAIATKGWPVARANDKRLIAAEMNGMDFDLRVLKPWARDPAFYASVWGEDSDVPEHEGPSIFPPIDLQSYKYPLPKADQAALTCLIGAIPKTLADARINLKDANARDLWVYGAAAFAGQSATLAALSAGTLDMRTLEGTKRADMTGADQTLLDAIAKARAAAAEFRVWLETEAPSKMGPSGVGRENYDWYMKNVHLVPYGWNEQVVILRRELERSRASLALEEFRNRNAPPLQPVNDAEAWRAMAKEKMQALTDFLIDNDLVADKSYFRDAMTAQIGDYTPPEKRNFFSHGMALDPSGLYSHSYHWIELARLKHEPHRMAVRAAEPLYDIYDARSEGLATAMEELLMHAGLYDKSPHSREIVWAMLANRAARGLASLYVQANEMTLEEAGRFHGKWTPRAWSDPKSDLVAFEQLLYLRQPGYGTSYITGKLALDRLISDYAFDQEQRGKAFTLPEFFRTMNTSGVVPFALIETDMTSDPLQLPETDR